MGRTRVAYDCSDCGLRHSKWAGQCSGCGAWATLDERTEIKEVAGAPVTGWSSGAATPFAEVVANTDPVKATGIGEFDRALGGGLVPGSVTLLGGEPGIGKSTLLLQLAASVSERGDRVLYVSAEESSTQLRRRADRLKLDLENVWVQSEDVAAAGVGRGQTPRARPVVGGQHSDRRRAPRGLGTGFGHPGPRVRADAARCREAGVP